MRNKIIIMDQFKPSMLGYAVNKVLGFKTNKDDARLMIGNSGDFKSGTYSIKPKPYLIYEFFSDEDAASVILTELNITRPPVATDTVLRNGDIALCADITWTDDLAEVVWTILYMDGQTIDPLLVSNIVNSVVLVDKRGVTPIVIHNKKRRSKLKKPNIK